MNSRFRRALRTFSIAPAVAAALALAGDAWAQSPGPNSRAEATAIVADMRRIVTAEGIERLETVHIGGIDQWVSIRGTDRRNPVLLMIHGGPGYASMPTSWYFQRGWEEYFTVVQWDQRGAGKTYVENDTAAVGATMTIPRMIEDAEEMVAWLRRELGKDRIFVLGHSWGSIVGLTLAHRRPEWLHAYIGMGQGIDGRESERRGWRFALERAQSDGNDEAIRELRSIAPYAEEGEPMTLEALYLQRRWLNHYGGAVHGRTSFAAEAAAVRLAPEYTDRDVAALWEGTRFSAEHLLIDVMELDLSEIDTLDVPILLFSGRHDHNVSSEVSAEWFARLRAPEKKLIWFENSAHEVMNEEPGRVLVSLVLHARPIAERAGDGPRR